VYYIVELYNNSFNVVEFSEDKTYIEQRCETLNKKVQEELELYEKAVKYVKLRKEGKATEDESPHVYVYFDWNKNVPYVLESERPVYRYEVRKVKKAEFAIPNPSKQAL
jgi:hypothetical protein